MTVPTALAPVLLALVPVFQSGVACVGLVPPEDWFPPLVFLALGAGAVVGLLRLRMGSWSRAVPVATALVALFHWSAPLVWTFDRLADLGLPLALAGAGSGVGALLVVGLLGRWCMERDPGDRPLVALGDFLLAFAGLLLLTGAGRLAHTAWVLDRRPLPLRHPEVLEARAPGPFPDLYWVVLDAYPRRDILERVHGLDNSGFYRALEERGFMLMHAACSNYATTAPSLASALNLDYLAPPPDRPVPDNQAYYAPLVRMVRESRLLGLLREKGYRSVAVTTGGYLFEGRGFDVRHQGRWSSFDHLVLGNTLADLFTTDLQLAARRGSLRDAFRRLPEVGSGEGPHFVLAHILAPHPPFVLGPGGEDQDPGYPRYTPLDYGGVFDYQMGPGWYSRHLGNQVQGVNHLLMEALDGILARRERPAVVLVTSDHGSASKRTKDFRTEDLRERFAILSSVRFPDGPDPRLGPATSLVNLLRVVASRVVGCDLPLLPDRTYHTQAAPGYGVAEVPRRLLLPEGFVPPPAPASASRATSSPGRTSRGP